MKTDIRTASVDLYFIPIQTRVPLKFGTEVCTEAVCARVCITVESRHGKKAQGWGETPLSVHWAWPSSLGYQQRCDALQSFCRILAEAWAKFDVTGHPIEIGNSFIESALPDLLNKFNQQQTEPVPWLAALVCCSAFDIALHDAYGQLLERDVYTTYHRKTLDAWHLVGGKDLLDESELTGAEPNDGYPVLLTDWIERDGLKCLKIKLRGIDSSWDYDRLVGVGEIAIEKNVSWLTSDFNCTVTEPSYVNDILDKLKAEQPSIYEMLLYVEQPFAYDLEKNQIDVHSLSARKPLFMDESAHDWKLIRLGRKLGWTGVALKTCKTQTGALLSLCWAKAHGMGLMVQDLTNPMLAQIPHLRLAAHTGTIMGVETNSMQFYPAVSAPEQAVHPGLYQRRDGQVDLSTLSGPGFGYRLDEIKRELPSPAASFTK